MHTRRLQFESLETREVLSGVTASWFNSHLSDSGVKSVVVSDYADNVLSRDDFLAVYQQVARDSTVSSAEFRDLRTLTNSAINMPEDVRSLSAKVAIGDHANATYQGMTLGNLYANSSALQLTLLVDKWFLGLDLPTIDRGPTYQTAQGMLFSPAGPQLTDVDQGVASDCYLLANAAELAKTNPAIITSAFVTNSDHTFAVRFYHNGAPDYVTVNTQLPTRADGTAYYAGFGFNVDGTASQYTNPDNVLWAALLEKAYVQENQSGWIGQDGTNSYAGINDGLASWALTQLSNLTSKRVGDMTPVSLQAVIAAYNAGKPVYFAAPSRASHPSMDLNIVGAHVYALVSYDPATQTFVLFNPWGIHATGVKPGLITQTFAQLANNFVFAGYGDTPVPSRRRS